jgi:putative cardiolipin synthase
MFSYSQWISETIEVDSVELAHDEVRAVKNSKVGTTKKLYEVLRNAKHTVIIDSPYLIMTRELKNIFKDLIKRNVSIRILTNSLKSTDGLFPAAGYLNQRRKIARMGIELYEYNSDDSFHSKSFVIDNEIAIIGSFNLDPRSENLNTETLAIIEDDRVAARLTDSMNSTLDSAYKIDNRGRPVGFSKRLPGVSLKKKIITRLLQIFITPWARGLL